MTSGGHYRRGRGGARVAVADTPASVPEYHSDWEADAVCAEVGAWPWFGTDVDSGGQHNARVKAAVGLCAGCPVWRQCRFVGLAETDGVWGGTQARERATFRNQAGITTFAAGRMENEEILEERVLRMRAWLNWERGDVDRALAHDARLEGQEFFHNFEVTSFVCETDHPPVGGMSYSRREGGTGNGETHGNETGHTALRGNIADRAAAS